MDTLLMAGCCPDCGAAVTGDACAMCGSMHFAGIRLTRALTDGREIMLPGNGLRLDRTARQRPAAVALEGVR